MLTAEREEVSKPGGQNTWNAEDRFRMFRVPWNLWNIWKLWNIVHGNTVMAISLER